ncbi:MAG: type I-E CRISPR-associated protein Cse2/CasB [Rothia sp. (in: high G+C Gram-positive bacteria)]|uniref:type I-E CRISPR-associated protein Cse2/CasB n=1 Tax=Rothia sp. (in: high G+C Gram-positive bacteria) TaxID=1885016 RepID=UPI0026E0CDD8|nr:type I-E CRISPR-associated protein Cse2/CasB [Rothia sp. (in: high G+C Gram-positive bacteria)]MDO5750833.1 type I-E CRISPR-associated protein Cse2/CasB [Rothia sp. (in: high G+C Gram-positive bacteria)]
MEKVTKSQQLAAYVGSQAAYLAHGVIQGRGNALARLANLRRGAGKSMRQAPEAWMEVLNPVGDGEGNYRAFPENLLSSGEYLTREERAAFTALTLFAVHQQSQLKPMHYHPDGKRGASFGYVAGQLVSRSSASMKNRFDAVLKARDEKVMAAHLRTLVQLFRVEGLPLDYGKFAVDYARLLNPEYRDSVILSWTRDFASGYRNVSTTQKEEN